MQALTVFIQQDLLSGITSLTLGTVCKSVFIRMEEENSGPRLLAMHYSRELTIIIKICVTSPIKILTK